MCAWSSAAGRGCFGKTRVRQVCLATVGCCRTALGDGEPGTGKTNGRAPGASALHLAVLGGHLVFAQAREICATKQTDVGNEKEEMLNWTASLDYQYNIGSNYYIYIYIKINKIIYIYIYPYFDHTHTPLLVSYSFYRCVAESSWTVEDWGLVNHRTHRFVWALCQELLNARCAVDTVDVNGQEPLHVAAIEGHSDLVLATWLQNKKSIEIPSIKAFTKLSSKPSIENSTTFDSRNNINFHGGFFNFMEFCVPEHTRTW